jgi:hypothetical protein
MHSTVLGFLLLDPLGRLLVVLLRLCRYFVYAGTSFMPVLRLCRYFVYAGTSFMPVLRLCRYFVYALI